MVKRTARKNRLTSWSKHCHRDHLGADFFETDFPLLNGTNIGVSTFPEKTVLGIGEVLKEEFQGTDYMACLDSSNNRRIYAFPNSVADAKLSLRCLFEGDSTDWPLNQAYFNDGKLVAVVSHYPSIKIPEEHKLATIRKSIYENQKTLIEVYEQEVDRLARSSLGYDGKSNPFIEMVQILKSDSPRGKGLHDSYRDAIREVLKR